MFLKGKINCVLERYVMLLFCKFLCLMLNVYSVFVLETEFPLP